MDINIIWCVDNRNLLDRVLVNKKLDIIEFLLQQKIDTKSLSRKENMNIINDNEQLRNLLLKYGVNLEQ